MAPRSSGTAPRVRVPTGALPRRRANARERPARGHRCGRLFTGSMDP
jgi:hypothetical protein